MFWYVLDKINKDKETASSINELHNLAQKLQDIYVDTDFKMLYIIVPVHNDWGNNERTFVQENIIGTKEYFLSHGETKSGKVHSYPTKRVINK